MGFDAAFKPGTGANGTLYAIAVQPDGRIVIGGDFTTFNEAPNTARPAECERVVEAASRSIR